MNMSILENEKKMIVDYIKIIKIKFVSKVFEP